MINMPAGPEIAVILMLALLVLGPDQLPKAMRSFGNVMAEIRKVSSSFQEEMREALDIMETTASAKDDTAEAGSRPSSSSDRQRSDAENPAAPASDALSTGADTTEGPTPEAGAAARKTSPDGATDGATDVKAAGRTAGEPTPGESTPPVTDPADRAAG